jgi:hypothetical protein
MTDWAQAADVPALRDFVNGSPRQPNDEATARQSISHDGQIAEAQRLAGDGPINRIPPVEETSQNHAPGPKSSPGPSKPLIFRWRDTHQPLFAKLCLLVAVCTWLGLTIWQVADHWSYENVDYEPPIAWQKQHPECRDRLGIWPDGSRMPAEVLDSHTSDAELLSILGIKPSPEQAAKNEWATDVRDKIASCEKAQWLPNAKAAAVNRRLRLLVFWLLPPSILFVGFAFIGINAIASKITMTIGFFLLSTKFADVLSDIGEDFINY